MTTLTLQTDVFQGSMQFKALQAWVDEVEVLSGGVHSILVLPSGSLVKNSEIFDAVEAGVFDLGWSTPSPFKFPDFAPLTGGSDLPIGPELSAALFENLPSSYFETYGVQLLAAATGAPDLLVGNGSIPATPDDLNGVNFGGFGLAGSFVTEQGGASVNIPIGELYQAFATGIVDAGLLTAQEILDLSLNTITDYQIAFPDAAGLYTPFNMLTINQDVFDALPSDLQTILEQTSGTLLSETIGAATLAEHNAAIAILEAQSDGFLELSGASLEAWSTALNLFFETAASDLGVMSAQLRDSIISFLLNSDLNLIGDSSAELLEGGNGNDYIFGDGGNDTLKAGSGNDLVLSGSGNDVAEGGIGSDTLYGGKGNDTLSGGNGNDQAFGGAGNDTMDGGGGNDLLGGGSGNDTLAGEAGNDTLWGSSGNDIISGGADDDFVGAGGNKDQVTGDSGNDTLYGGGGKDTVNGGTDDDLVAGGAGTDLVIGGGGDDTLWGQAGADTLNGENGNDSIAGGAQGDKLNGQQGDDTLNGGFGNDTLSGGADDDVLNGNFGKDVMTGGQGADTFVFDENGAKTVTDFDASEGDMLQIDNALFGGANLSAAQVVAQFADDSSGTVIFDFGGGNTLTLDGVSSTTGLADDLTII